MKNIFITDTIYSSDNLSKNNKILISFLYLFWIGQFFATVNIDSPDLKLHGIYTPIRDFYDTQINQFPGFELVAVLLSLVVLLKFIKCYTSPNSSIKIFLIISLVFVFISLLNPKNAFQYGIIEFLKFRATNLIIFCFIWSNNFVIKYKCALSFVENVF